MIGNFKSCILFYVSISIKRTILIHEKEDLIRTHRADQRRGDSFLVYVMAKKEILAEKIRAIFDDERNKARDLYDLWFLIKGGTDVDVPLIAKKLAKAGQRHSLNRLQARIRALGDYWEELTPLMDRPPNYDTVAKDVIGAFRYLEV